jgi:Uncharacterized protein conserved in bacteria
MTLFRRAHRLSLTIILAGLAIGALPAPVGPRIAQGAQQQVGVMSVYDPSYVSLSYPGGDVPVSRGVCADVVVRAFRAAGIDLQREVHEDMVHAFKRYPAMWALAAPDKNIDHRRVPNLMKFFERRGKTASLPFLPGDTEKSSLNRRGHFQVDGQAFCTSTT